MLSKKKSKVFSVMSAIALLVVTLSVALAPNIAANAATENVSQTLYNGAAEINLNGYRLYSPNGISTAAVDSAVTHEGKSSLLLQSAETDQMDVNIENQGITLKAGWTVKVSGFIKTENISGGGVSFAILNTDIATGFISGTNDWKYVEAQGTISSDVDFHAIYNLLWSTGKAWFQGFKVETVVADANVLYDGAAEISTDGCRAWICNEDGSGTFGVDSIVTHNGKPSLKLSATVSNIVDVNYNVNKVVTNGSTLKLSGFVKTDNLAGVGAKIVMNGASMETQYFSGTKDWTYFEVSKTLTGDVTLGEICYDITWSTGSVWFQGVKIEIVESDSDVFYDGAAERDTSGCRPWICNEDGTGSFGVDGVQVHNDKPSLRLSATASNIVDVNYNINKAVPSGTVLKLSGYVKTDNLIGSGAKIVLNGAGMESPVYSGTQNWTYFEVIKTLTENITLGELCYDLQWSTGSVWFQGARVESLTVKTLYTIDASSSEGGTISHNGQKSIAEGDNATYTFTADTGYEIDTVTVDGTAVEISGNTYTFENVAANHTISVIFKKKTFVLNATAGEGGSITPSGDTTVAYGDNQVYTILSNAEYEVDLVKVDGKAIVMSGNTYTFENVVDAHTISVTFKKIVESDVRYIINASAGEHGSISPSGAVTVSKSDSKTFIISMDVGYEYDTVTVDGVSVELTGNSYTFTNVSADHSIAITFKKKTFTVSASVGAGGSITPSGDVNVAYGDSKTFTVQAETGYQIDTVKVDGKAVNLANNSYTFENVTAAHSIDVTFKKLTFTIAASAGSHGSISPSGDNTVEYDADKTFTITPDKFYTIETVKVNGETITLTGNTYTFKNVQAAHSISVTFVQGELPRVLYDSDAETNLSAYSGWIWDESIGSYAMDNTVTRDGKPSLRLSATESNIVDVYVKLGIKLKKGETLKFSGYVKTENLESNGNGAKIVMRGPASANWKPSIESQYFTDTMDWIFFEKSYTAPEDVEIYDIFYDITWSKGTAWFQGLKLEKVEETAFPDDPGDVPYLPPEDDDDDDIFDNTTDHNTNDNDIGSDEESPVTGDNTNIAFVFAIAVSCMAAAVVTFRKRIHLTNR